MSGILLLFGASMLVFPHFLYEPRWLLVRRLRHKRYLEKKQAYEKEIRRKRRERKKRRERRAKEKQRRQQQREQQENGATDNPRGKEADKDPQKRRSKRRSSKTKVEVMENGASSHINHGADLEQTGKGGIQDNTNQDNDKVTRDSTNTDQKDFQDLSNGSHPQTKDDAQKPAEEEEEEKERENERKEEEEYIQHKTQERREKRKRLGRRLKGINIYISFIPNLLNHLLLATGIFYLHQSFAKKKLF